MRPTSASGMLSSKRRQSGTAEGGFTLIEILVVLIIVGLLASLAVVNLTGNSRLRELQQQVRDVYLLMQAASEQAVLNNREYGLVLEEGGYRFVAMDDESGDWITNEERIFRPRTLPEWLVVTVQVAADAPRLPSDDKEGPQPEIVFYSSGETTPFELAFSVQEGPTVRHVIRSDGFSPMEWLQPGAEEVP
ncbi:general secretion pathway protein H [Marinobacter persicus]|uniref:Type II secretion system protein H n=2 Tax=Marinobacter persicus TaxID=930118 RepID=A0A2S6G5D9_9GAMM|nr:general secretion pathway protein H [Marinobacter persicus]PPK54223.1 general secretion pathway protein H [Marinobacter persicus]PPK57359.1 general secretion pathway protein H [Marinobacter persicus]